MSEGKWRCESCVHYPPSACDGKPCCICEPGDQLLDCYQMRTDETELLS